MNMQTPQKSVAGEKTLEPAPKSRNAEGRVTITIGKFPQDKIVTHNDVSWGMEVHSYATGARETIPGGVLALMRQVFSGEIAGLLRQIISAKPEFSIELKHLFSLSSDTQILKIAERLFANRWDIVLLINTNGGRVGMQLAVEEFINKQKGETSVTTIATNDAISAGANLFAQGETRIAKQATKFSLHLPTINNDSRRPIFCDRSDRETALNKYAFSKLKRVAQTTATIHSKPLAERLIEAWNDTSNPDGRVDWLGADSPGFVSKYFDTQSRVKDQLQVVLGRPIFYKDDRTDIVANFAQDSAVEDKFRERGMNVSFGSLGANYLANANTTDTADLRRMVNEILDELTAEDEALT